MLQNEREQEILSILRSCGYASVKTLSRQLFTSESSIRRALAGLEEKGLAKRSYGGAALLESHSNVLPFEERYRRNVAAKQAIARKAAPLVGEGSILFLDGSSTAFYLAAELQHRSGLTVVTNNPEILSLLSRSKCTVYCSGGRLSEENRSCLVGPDAQRTFEGIYGDFVFFSTNALTADGIITDCTREEVAVREVMLRNARKKVFLCDSGKLGHCSAYRQCDLSQVDTLICETEMGGQFAEVFPRLQIL